MTNKMNEILKEFNAIRKGKSKPTIIGKIIIAIYFVSIIVEIITFCFDNKLSTNLSQQLAIGGLMVAFISLFLMIRMADHEKEPNYNFNELKKINDILNNKKIVKTEEREILKKIITNSINHKGEKLVGVSALTSLLLSPVYFYFIDIILKQGLILAYDNGNIYFGPYMPIYIKVVIGVVAIIGIMNVIRIMKEKDDSIKKALLRVIDEIELWQKMNEDSSAEKDIEK